MSFNGLILDSTRTAEEVLDILLTQQGRSFPEDAVWTVAAGYDEFTLAIGSNPLPDVILFDYDLGTPETGADCAGWLLKYLHKVRLSLPTFYIHSSNEEGSAAIRAVIDTALADGYIS